jgi:hypothetical protein
MAVGLELIPFLAPLVLLVALATWSSALFGTSLAVAVASGIGWMKLRCPRQAMFIVVLRGALLLALLWWGLTESINDSIGENYFPEEHDASPKGTYLMVAAGTFFVVSTLASSGGVFLMSRRRAVA